MMQRRTFLAGTVAAAAATALKPADAEPLPLGDLPNWRYPDPRVEALDKRFKARVGNAAIERIATGFRWAEGPVYVRDGGYLLWSDIPNNRIMRWLEDDGHLSVFRANSNYSNGNIFGNYEGHLAELELPARVYRLDAKSGQASVVADDFDKPNGLAFSADEKKLYIIDSGLTHGGRSNMRVFDVTGDKLANGKVFAENFAPGFTDGVRTDIDGNVWCSMGWADPKEDGVRCYAPNGDLIGKIHLPETCANLTFGGKKRNRLFMTASTSVYSVYVETVGAMVP